VTDEIEVSIVMPCLNEAETCLTLGCQIVFGSFFLSVLGLRPPLRRRRARQPREDGT
jgi:hypothetical protein